MGGENPCGFHDELRYAQGATGVNSLKLLGKVRSYNADQPEHSVASPKFYARTAYKVGFRRKFAALWTGSD